MKRNYIKLMQDAYRQPCIKAVSLRGKESFLAASFHDLKSNEAFVEEEEEVDWDINY